MTTQEFRVTSRQAFGASVKEQSLLADTLRRLLKNRGATIGALFVIALIVMAISAPLIAPYDPIEISPAESKQAPSLQHPAGTDPFGRDLLSRIIFGTRISLRLGLISVSISLTVGGIVALCAGYYGGAVDRIAGILVNIMLAFPGILLALSIAAVLGPGLDNAMLAVGISAIPDFLRVIRGAVMSVKAEVYIEAAKSIGCTNRRIMFRHIAPNVLAPAIVLTTLWVGTAILVGASLSFLGLGAQRPTPEWGLMVSEGREYLRTAWWLTAFPGLIITLTVIALNLLGDGLRDALDPRLRK